MKTDIDRYRILFDSSSDPHFIMGETGILDCNEATVRILKCSSKEDVLKIHPALLSPEYQPDGSESLEKSRRMDAIAAGIASNGSIGRPTVPSFPWRS